MSGTEFPLISLQSCLSVSLSHRHTHLHAHTNTQTFILFLSKVLLPHSYFRLFSMAQNLSSIRLSGAGACYGNSISYQKSLISCFESGKFSDAREAKLISFLFIYLTLAFFFVIYYVSFILLFPRFLLSNPCKLTFEREFRFSQHLDIFKPMANTLWIHCFYHLKISKHRFFRLLFTLCALTNFILLNFFLPLIFMFLFFSLYINSFFSFIFHTYCNYFFSYFSLFYQTFAFIFIPNFCLFFLSLLKHY